MMSTLWTKMLPELERCSTRELRQRYQQLFGESTQANNKPWLIRRIAWRWQAQAEGGLSAAVLQRAQELA
jgi:hypothetical protein